MADFRNHYQTLQVSRTASQAEIKQAYRRLAKLLHPDSNLASASHEQIALVNVAYEILGDPQKRFFYDQQLNFACPGPSPSSHHTKRGNRQKRAATAQSFHRQQRRSSGRTADEALNLWLQQVYSPVTRLLVGIIKSLPEQIDWLAADPFDDELMEDFQTYLEDCRDRMQQAQATFRSMPNPANTARVAAQLYYCLNQVNDGIEELEFFTLNYDDGHLHTGQELFRIANGLRREAQAAAAAIPAR